MAAEHRTTTTASDADEQSLAPPTDSPDTSSDGDEPSVEFTIYCGTYSGVEPNQRRWRISPTLGGWRLEYRDPDDSAWSYSGRHQSLRAAQLAAGRTRAPHP